jgi:alanyl-tRNA synthetase
MERTLRLFDLYPANSRFEATVVSCVETEGGKYEAVLDKTLFFPEEGGQSCDTGSVGGARVEYVFEKAGVIYHIIDDPLCAGASVVGEIDYGERFRKMQNHTAEHIVSGLIHKNFGFHNVGFHLSRDEMTADFDGELSSEQIKLIETEANRAIFECRPVRGYYPTPEELARLEYRSKLDLSENVRIVEIEGVDLCACCAPHVGNTGEIGLVKILYAEKYKGGVRLYMKAGFDALEGYRDEYEQCRRISVAISAKHSEVADGVDRILEDIDGLKSKIAQMKKEIMALRLERIEYTDGNLVLFENDGDMLALRNLVNEAKKRCGGICACFSGNDDTGYKYIISSTTVDLRAKSKEINAAIFGRGGGSSEMIQGSCTAKREEIENYFKF